MECRRRLLFFQGLLVLCFALIAATDSQSCDPFNSILCSAGSYCDTSYECVECPAGFYCPFGDFSIARCAVGTYCVAGSSSELLCEKGTYNPVEEQSACLSVPKGKQLVC